jgi:Concanavalin A-like lectin/glucanases superfamily
MGAARERGVALLLVLIAVAMATVLSMSFLSSQATSMGVSQNVLGHAQARSVAESALVVAINYVQTDASWRTDKAEGQWASNVSFNGGTFDLYGYDGIDTDGDGVVDDTDGDLSDDSSDPVTLKVVSDVDGVSHTVFAVVTVGGGSALNVLMITDDASSLGTMAQDKYDLLIGWGMTVTLISDNDSQANFDAAMALADVVYAAEPIISGTVGSKVSNASIGVVSDEDGLNDDLGISSSGGSKYNGSQIDIVSNTHYITSTVSIAEMDDLAITTGSEELTTVSGTLGSGVTVLATRDSGSGPTLAVVDAGGQLEDGSNAVGRRVALPWGSTGINIKNLNDAGKTILKRSLEWAGQSITPQAPLARWQLDETTGTTADDSVGNNDGTYKNGVTQGQAGVDLYASEFDGSNDFIEVPHNDAFLLDNGSVSLWFNADNVSSHHAMFSKDSSGYDTGGHLHIYVEGSRLKVRIQSTGTSYSLQSSATLSTGSWHHAVFTFGAGGAVLYLDGQVVDTDSYTGGLGTTSGGVGNYEPIAIGAGTWNSGNLTTSSTTYHYEGLIDDARMYNYALSGAEVVSLYDTLSSSNTGSPQLIALYEFQEIIPPAPALVGHWKLDEQIVTSGVDVLLVVADASSLTSQDSAKKSLMESWGHTVTLISDDDSQANFDVAATLVDVAYVTEEVSSSTLDTKLQGAVVGVVNEEKNLMDEFGISSTNGNFTSDSIEIEDNSHYITQIYSVSDHVTILTSSSALIRSSGSIGGGVTTLATRTSGSDKVLTVLDTGAAMYGGGFAAGRRVQLPWGDDAFDFSLLSSDGQTIMKRSLEWAAAGRAIDEVAANDGEERKGVVQGQPGNGDGGTAFGFDGSDDYVEIAHNDDYLLNSGALSFWFKSDSLSGQRKLFSKDSSGYDTGGHFTVYTNGSTLYTRLQSTSASYYVQSSGVSTGVWYHVLVSFGSGGLKLYLDGVLVDSDSYSGGLGTTSGGVGNYEPIAVGSNTWNSDNLVVTPLNSYFDGTIDDVRLYDSGFDATQAANVYGGSPPGTSVANTVYDTSGFGSALDLDIQDTGNVSWVPGGGLSIDSDTLIVSPSAASKLYSALAATDQMTLEVVFTPANLTQGGPARIVSYSTSASSRNFTFGQEGDDYVQRLRTSSTTSNGTPNIVSANVLTTSAQHHVIVTYDGQDVKLYRGGVLETTGSRTGTFNWGSSYRFMMGDEITGGREWLGELYRVAIYDLALNASQVADVFAGNAPGTGSGGVSSVDWIER